MRSLWFRVASHWQQQLSELYLLVATFLCANRAGTVATVRIEITDVNTTNALTAASKGTPKDFARMCSVRPHCDLFGHVNKKNCKHKHCINV